MANVAGFIAALLVAVAAFSIIYRLLEMRTQYLEARVKELESTVKSKDEAIEILWAERVDKEGELRFSDGILKTMGFHEWYAEQQKKKSGGSHGKR